MDKFKLYIKRCYRIVWSVEKIQKKIQKLQRQKMEQYCFYQNVQCVIVKKSKFIKHQDTSGLLSSLGIKTRLSKIPLVGSLLF